MKKQRPERLSRSTPLVVAGAFAFALLAMFSTSACDMHNSYEEFAEEGERVYPAKLDTAWSVPGLYRIQLNLDLPADPSLTEARVFWNLGGDSLRIPIERPAPDTVTTIIEGLQSGSRTFNVHTLDAEGNESLAYTVTGRVYSEAYVENLNRRVVRRAYFEGDNLLVDWAPSPEDAVGTMVRYTTTSGMQDSSYVTSPEATTDTLYNFDFEANGTLQYNTRFVPGGASIDVFETEDVLPGEAASIEYPRDGWTVGATSWGGGDFEPQHAIDNDMNTFWISQWWGGLDLPQTLEVDPQGMVTDAEGIMVTQRPDYTIVTSFAVEVSDDGETWDRVGEYLAVTDLGPQYYEFEEDPGSFRYFRVTVLSGDEQPPLEEGLATNHGGFGEVTLYR